MKYFMLIVILLVTGCSNALYPNGFFTELVSGDHYDCEAIKNGEINANDWSTDKVMDAIDYCRSDRMHDYLKCYEDRQHAYDEPKFKRLAPAYCMRYSGR